MSHEITETDQVVLHKTSAWHRMGILVDEAPTPREALTIGGLDWGVRQEPLYYEKDGKFIDIVKTVANFRADTDELLGVVSVNYVPVTNRQVADFCTELLEDHIVRCETVGSVQGGKRVWFLLKGAPFEVAHGDEIYPYILVSNSHDGTASFRVTPTTIRTVCSNTLHAVIPRDDDGQLGTSALSIRHTLNIMDRVHDARRALKHYSDSIEKTKEVINTLVAKDVNQENVQQFFLESYTSAFGPVPDSPKTKVEENRRNRALSAFDSFSKRFDDDRPIAGANMWNAFNAFSGLVQHDKKARGNRDIDRIEKRIESNLFGLNEERTHKALQMAYEISA